MILPLYARGGNGLPAERVVHAAYCRTEPAGGVFEDMAGRQKHERPRRKDVERQLLRGAEMVERHAERKRSTLQRIQLDSSLRSE